MIYDYQNENGKTPFLCFILLPAICSIIYLTTIILISFYILNKKIKILNEKIKRTTSFEQFEIYRNLKTKIYGMVYRVVLYTTVPILVQILTVYNFIHMEVIFIIEVFEIIILGLAGFFTLFCLLIDPALHYALNELFGRKNKIGANLYLYI